MCHLYETFSASATYSGCMDEKTLIQAVLAGESDSFAPLVERYRVGLIIYCEQFAGERSSAEDIAQDAFIKAYNVLKSYDPDKALFSTWLYRIARTTALDYLRRQKKTYDIDETGEVEDTATEIDEQRKIDVRQAVGELEPPIYKSIIEDFYWQGDSYETIAERYELPINTVRTNIRRAKEKLKGVLS